MRGELISYFRLSLAALALLITVPLIAPRADEGQVALTIKELLTQENVTLDGRRLDARNLRRFYDGRDNMPFWSGDRGQAVALPLLEVILNATDHGLDPADYNIEALAARSAAANDTQRAERDLLLSDAYMRYAANMRMGRLRLDRVEVDWFVKPTPFDAAASLAAIASAADMRRALADLPPSNDHYQRLVEALKQFTAQARDKTWPGVSAGATLKPGMSDGRVVELRQRLIAEGFLAADQGDSPLFDKPLEAALRKWQTQYGMEIDGWVGPRMVGALNISLLSRIEQIKINMERQRSLPRQWPDKAIYVNAAATELVMVEYGQTVHTARVIVGAAPTPTPVLGARFSSMLLNPSWFVPRSIATKEFLPLLQRDPHYLAKNNMVIVGRTDDPSGETIDWRRYNINFLPFTFQQLPSPKTALGNVVFDMPNPMDVYLHDTPDRTLFARGERYFSHGCIRVENPRALALYLLHGNTQWTDQRYDETVATDDTQRVAIAQPVPIFLLYATAIPGRQGGIEFRTDIYKRDQRLSMALETQRAQPDAYAVIYDDLIVKPVAAVPVKATTPITIPGAIKPVRATMAP